MLRHNVFLLRRLHYEEIASVDAVRALHYLQTSLSESIDHDDPAQLREFHKMASLLFRADAQPNGARKCRAAGATTAPIDAVESMDTMADHDGPPASPSSSSSMVSLPSSPPTPASLRGQRSRLQQAHDLHARFSEHDAQQRRALLYNKIVVQLPEHMVQPVGRLSEVAAFDAEV